MFPYILVFLLSNVGSVIAQQPGKEDGPIYSPLRPPSVPLAVRSPYTSAWSTTSGGSTLNSRNVTFWTGRPMGWSGIIRVDGTAYEYMGDSPSLQGLQKATSLTVSYDSHFSNFTFEAGPVQVQAQFFSPVLPRDLCRSSVPLSYLNVAYVANDELSHDVQLYSDVDATWLAGGNASLRWDLDCPGEINCPSKGTETPDTLFHWEAEIVDDISWSERGRKQEPYWGKLHYVSSSSIGTELDFANGLAGTIRRQFIRDGRLDRTFDHDQLRRPDDRVPVFAFSHGFPSSQSGSVLYTVGTTQEPAVNYRTASGDVELQPYWIRHNCYISINALIITHYQDYSAAAKEAKLWTMQLRHDVALYYAKDKTTNTPAYISSLSEEDSYYAILALSTRQILAANVLTESADNTTEPTVFQKEISSDGKVNTVDVIYPALPFWLYANPDLLRLLLKPIFEFQESGLYHERYAMHDIGRFYPDAIGYYSSSIPDEYGEEAMPVEEREYAFLASHFDMLKRWTQYLIEKCLYPEHQTTTDDFNEPIANNSNLAIKGIVAINSMGAIASVLGDIGLASRWILASYTYYELWAESAISPSVNHTLLAYQLPSSYSILYNIFPALLFNLRAIPKPLFAMQSAFYPTVAEKYGVPLDNRHLWTKSDWEMWAAAACELETRALFVTSLARWINETSTDKALCDHFMTTGDGGYSDYPFVARPVVRGHFALLAMGVFGKHGGLNEEDE